MEMPQQTGKRAKEGISSSPPPLSPLISLVDYLLVDFELSQHLHTRNHRIPPRPQTQRSTSCSRVPTRRPQEKHGGGGDNNAPFVLRRASLDGAKDGTHEQPPHQLAWLVWREQSTWLQFATRGLPPRGVRAATKGTSQGGDRSDRSDRRRACC